jgi:hypothetical protein
VIGLVAIAQAGCLLAAAGAAGGAVAGYMYFQGRVCEAYSASFDDAWRATHVAMGELGMPVNGEERSADAGSIESRTPDGELVRIAVDMMSPGAPGVPPVSRVCVRVATFGDHPFSERLLGQVATHLPASPPAVLGAPGPVPAAAAAPQSGEPPLLQAPTPAPPR